MSPPTKETIIGALGAGFDGIGELEEEGEGAAKTERQAAVPEEVAADADARHVVFVERRQSPEMRTPDAF